MEILKTSVNEPAPSINVIIIVMNLAMTDLKIKNKT